ncbi:hypothetical protein QR680_017760 [Steinernema hermaphroditum]|uniref:Uncharacterized protein n=1 Tax=Steinernema hermaphroditum TaxID=289476 RepID=A0AA39LP84_9BILA|nr:hypothetical protein QR680_017760 [Steinernema hermaphroditum]
MEQENTDDLRLMPKEQLIEGFATLWQQHKTLGERNKFLLDEQANLKKSLEQATSKAALNMHMAEETERDFNELKQKFEKTTLDLTEKIASLSKLQKVVEDLREEIEQDKAESQKKDEEFESVRSELKDAKNYIKHLEASCSSNTSFNGHGDEELERKLDELQEELELAAIEIAEKNETISSLRMKEEELTEAAEHSKAVFEDFNSELSSLRKQLLEAQEYISNVESSAFNAAPDYKNNGCSIFAEFDDARMKQENDMRVMAQKNEALRRQMKDLSDECETLRCEVLSLRNLSGGKGDYDNEFVDKLCNENRECHDRITKLTETVRKLEDDLVKGTTAAPSLISYKSMVDELKARNCQLQSERDRFFDENATLRNKCGAVENSLQRTEYELTRTQGRLDKALAERDGHYQQKPGVKVEQIISESEIVPLSGNPDTPAVDKENGPSSMHSSQTPGFRKRLLAAEPLIRDPSDPSLLHLLQGLCDILMLAHYAVLGIEIALQKEPPLSHQLQYFSMSVACWASRLPSFSP